MKKLMFGSVIVVMLIAALVAVVGFRHKVAADTLTCFQVYGTLTTQVVAPGETQGTLTHAGRLNGTTRDLITSYDSSTGTYTASFQDGTGDGTLATQDKGQFFPDGTFVENGIVDGSASTGQFAGATGSLVFNGSTTDGVQFTATVTGQICETDQ